MPRIPLTFDQVRQCAIDAVADCQAMASDDSRDDPEVIHDLRITGKKLRAWGRLMRQTWGDSTWRSVDGWAREMCHLLAGARDEHVQQQTLNQLADISESRSKTKTLSSVGLLQAGNGFQCQKIGVAGTGANKTDKPGSGSLCHDPASAIR